MRYLAIIALAVALVVAACGDDDGAASGDAASGDPSADLYGEWTTAKGNQWAYHEDGTWEFTLAGGADPHAWGPYTFDGQTLSYTAEKSFDCGVGSSAVYDISFPNADTMVLALVEDDCSPRAGDAAAGPFTRSGP